MTVDAEAAAKKPRRERSAETKKKIAEAALAVIAEHGVAGLTHRLVAKQAGVSLAATTYHYDTKFDIIQAAAERIFSDYDVAFQRVAERRRTSPDRSWTFEEFIFQMVASAVTRSRSVSIAWYEIVLQNTRTQKAAHAAGGWLFVARHEWFEIAKAMGVPRMEEVALRVTDTLLSLVLTTLSLGLTRDDIQAVLLEGKDPLIAWAHAAPNRGRPPAAASGSKGAYSRDRILAAAINLLVSDGAVAVTHRAIAAETRLAHTAIAYYFKSIEDLLSAAQEALFEELKMRNEASMIGSGDAISIDDLADFDSVMLVRDATQHQSTNLASFSIWLEAARRPELRPMVWTAFETQYDAWQRLAEQVKPDSRPIDGLLLFSLFTGKLMRVMSTGSTIPELARVRRQFADDFRALAENRFWY
jgi:AcrR family transcriptional regulator